MDIDLDDFVYDLAKGADGELSKRMIYRAAPYALEKLKVNLQRVVSGKSSGDLINSIGLTKINQDRDGYWNIKVGFGGKDRNGVRNGLKAGVLEHGKSGQPARPFVTQTARQIKSQVEQIMQKVVDEEVEKNGNS